MTVTYRFGRFELRPATRQLLVDEQPATLGTRAFDVLLALIERRDRLVNKNELLDLVWPGLVVEENNLQVQVSALRKLLGPQVILTIPGRGYRFIAEVDGPATAHVCLWPLTAAISSSAAATGSLRNLPFTLTARSRRAAPIASRWVPSASTRRRPRRSRAS